MKRIILHTNSTWVGTEQEHDITDAFDELSSKARAFKDNGMTFACGSSGWVKDNVFNSKIEDDKIEIVWTNDVKKTYEKIQENKEKEFNAIYDRIIEKQNKEAEKEDITFGMGDLLKDHDEMTWQIIRADEHKSCNGLMFYTLVNTQGFEIKVTEPIIRQIKYIKPITKEEIETLKKAQKDIYAYKDHIKPKFKSKQKFTDCLGHDWKITGCQVYIPDEWDPTPVSKIYTIKNEKGDEYVATEHNIIQMLDEPKK